MIKKKLLILTCLAVAIFICSPSFSDTFAQEGQDQEVKARQGAASKGNSTDKNITDGKETNSKDSKAQPPAKKGGKAKGAGCEVQLDNWTRLKIKIYIDGKYQGVLAPFGEAYSVATPGRVKVYARADFDNGTFKYWGPRDYSCRPNQYIYFKMVN